MLGFPKGKKNRSGAHFIAPNFVTSIVMVFAWFVWNLFAKVEIITSRLTVALGFNLLKNRFALCYRIPYICWPAICKYGILMPGFRSAIRNDVDENTLGYHITSPCTESTSMRISFLSREQGFQMEKRFVKHVRSQWLRHFHRLQTNLNTGYFCMVGILWVLIINKHRQGRQQQSFFSKTYHLLNQCFTVSYWWTRYSRSLKDDYAPVWSNMNRSESWMTNCSKGDASAFKFICKPKLLHIFKRWITWQDSSFGYGTLFSLGNGWYENMCWNRKSIEQHLMSWCQAEYIKAHIYEHASVSNRTHDTVRKETKITVGGKSYHT